MEYFNTNTGWITKTTQELTTSPLCGWTYLQLKISSELTRGLSYSKNDITVSATDGCRHETVCSWVVISTVNLFNICSYRFLIDLTKAKIKSTNLGLLGSTAVRSQLKETQVSLSCSAEGILWLSININMLTHIHQIGLTQKPLYRCFRHSAAG